MALVRLEMPSGLKLVMESKMVLEIVTENVVELEMASGMPSESKLIGHVCFEEIHIV
jgi:hypothetical protein